MTHIKIYSTFTFWLENKTDQCFELPADTLVSKFIRWLYTKENDWLDHYGSETIVRYFLTCKTGINSTFKESQLPSIMHYLKPIYIQHTFPETIKYSIP